MTVAFGYVSRACRTTPARAPGRHGDDHQVHRLGAAGVATVPAPRVSATRAWLELGVSRRCTGQPRWVSAHRWRRRSDRPRSPRPAGTGSTAGVPAGRPVLTRRAVRGRSRGPPPAAGPEAASGPGSGGAGSDGPGPSASSPVSQLPLIRRNFRGRARLRSRIATSSAAAPSSRGVDLGPPSVARARTASRIAEARSSPARTRCRTVSVIASAEPPITAYPFSSATEPS